MLTRGDNVWHCGQGLAGCRQADLLLPTAAQYLACHTLSCAWRIARAELASPSTCSKQVAQGRSGNAGAGGDAKIGLSQAGAFVQPALSHWPALTSLTEPLARELMSLGDMAGLDRETEEDAGAEGTRQRDVEAAAPLRSLAWCAHEAEDHAALLLRARSAGASAGATRRVSEVWGKGSF